MDAARPEPWKSAAFEVLGASWPVKHSWHFRGVGSFRCVNWRSALHFWGTRLATQTRRGGCLRLEHTVACATGLRHQQPCIPACECRYHIG